MQRFKNKHKQQGVALIMVLWMIMVMLSLSATLVYAVRIEVQMVMYARESAQARALAEAVAHYAVMQLYLPQEQRELVPGGAVHQWQYQAYQADMTLMGENGLIDLNRASRPLMQKVLLTVGVSEAEINSWLDRIEDFRDADDLRRLNGAEQEDYEREGWLAGVKNAPFDRVEELQQVLGMTADLYQRLAPYFSVHSRGQGVNPMMAPYHVLLMLADGDAAAVEQYLQQRQEAQGDWVLPPFGGAFWEASQLPYYRLKVRVQQEAGQSVYREERLLRLLPGRNPPFITYYRQPFSEDQW